MSAHAMRILAPLFAAVALAGCGSGAVSTQAKPTPWHALKLAIPAELAGYDTKEEPQAEQRLRQGGADSLLVGGAFWSLRREARLFATLEIGELRPSTDIADAAVRSSIVNQVGEQAHTTKVGGTTVYESTANRQLIFVWFTGRYMHVLLAHDISDPATLVAAAVRLP
jgi:hypothetical protein